MSGTVKIIKDIFSSRNILVITLTQSLFMLTATLWWPYWSRYIVELGATKYQLGIVFMLEQSSQLILQLPGGILADKLGRKRVIVLSSVFRALSPVVYLAFQKWYLVVPGMVLTQVSSMMMPAVNAMIAESMPQENRAASYGVYRMMTWGPMIFTALIGGMIVDQLGIVPGVRFCIALTLVTAWLNVFLRWRYLEDTYVADTSEASPKFDLSGSMEVLKSVPRTVWYLVIVAALSSLAVRAASGFMFIYVEENLAITATQWGIITTVASIVSTLLTVPSGLLSDRIGRKPVIIVSRILQPLMVLGFPLSMGFWGIFISRMLGAVGEGFGGTVMGIMGGPAWQALVADIIPADRRGRIMGLMGTLIGLLSLPGTWLGGYLYDFVNPMAPFYTSFGLGIVATIIFIFLVKEPEKQALVLKDS
jgi:MFS family permease